SVDAHEPLPDGGDVAAPVGAEPGRGQAPRLRARSLGDDRALGDREAPLADLDRTPRTPVRLVRLAEVRRRLRARLVERERLEPRGLAGLLERAPHELATSGAHVDVAPVGPRRS